MNRYLKKFKKTYIYLILFLILTYLVPKIPMDFMIYLTLNMVIIPILFFVLSIFDGLKVGFDPVLTVLTAIVLLPTLRIGAGNIYTIYILSQIAGNLVGSAIRYLIKKYGKKDVR